MKINWAQKRLLYHYIYQHHFTVITFEKYRVNEWNVYMYNVCVDVWEIYLWMIHACIRWVMKKEREMSDEEMGNVGRNEWGGGVMGGDIDGANILSRSLSEIRGTSKCRLFSNCCLKSLGPSPPCYMTLFAMSTRSHPSCTLSLSLSPSLHRSQLCDYLGTDIWYHVN